MAAKPTKAVVIGLDAPIVKSIKKYMKQGVLPTFARLVKRGVWADHCLVPHPTITPPNWTTIVTGAWAGTHDVTCFNVHKPGDPLDQIHQGFLAEDCHAEYIWNAAARDSKRTILINYPTTWPNCVNKGIQIAGAGLAPNEYRVGVEGFSVACGLSADMLFTTEDLPLATVVALHPAEGWKNMPRCRKALAAPLAIEARQPAKPVKTQQWHLLVLDTTGRGYDRVVVSKTKDAAKALCTLRVGQWSERLVETFTVGKANKKAVFRIKLLELSTSGRRLKLYMTPLCQLDGWAFPASVCKELADVDGLPVPNTFYHAHGLDWIDSQTLVEVIDQQHTWLADAACQLMANHPWDLYFMHAHCPDHCYHSFVNRLEPTVCKDKKVLREYQAAERAFYQSLDRMIARIVKAAGDDAVVVLVSDHGAVPTEGAMDPGFKGFNVGDILRDAGLTVFKKNRKTGREEIDWRRTKAFAQRSVYVYVNLKGRDPQGIVKPGQEYDDLCNRIVDLLTDYRDPNTGKKPIALALKKPDARIIGLYGDYIGDVVYGVHAEVSGEHGRQLPTGEYGMGDMHGLFMMSGPGVKRGLRLERTVWLPDVTPTLCYLLGLPVPAQAEGAVLYQALQDPEAHLAELKQVRENYERLKGAYGAEKALTHSYEHGGD